MGSATPTHGHQPPVPLRHQRHLFGCAFPQITVCILNIRRQCRVILPSQQHILWSIAHVSMHAIAARELSSSRSLAMAPPSHQAPDSTPHRAAHCSMRSIELSASGEPGTTGPGNDTMRQGSRRNFETWPTIRVLHETWPTIRKPLEIWPRSREFFGNLVFLGF